MAYGDLNKSTEEINNILENALSKQDASSLFATKEELTNATPTIGSNGNWFINGIDTGKPAKGADGVSLGEVALVQAPGTSTQSIMSQKAVTNEFLKLDHNKVGVTDSDSDHLCDFVDENGYILFYIDKEGYLISKQK